MRTVYFSYTIYLINEKNSNFVGGDWSQFPSGGKISSTLAKERTRRLGMVYNYYFFTQRFTQYAFISKRNIKAKFQMCTLPNTKCCSVSFKKVMEARNCSLGSIICKQINRIFNWIFFPRLPRLQWAKSCQHSRRQRSYHISLNGSLNWLKSEKQRTTRR